MTLDISPLPLIVADGLKFLRENKYLKELCLRGQSLCGSALSGLVYSLEPVKIEKSKLPVFQDDLLSLVLNDDNDDDDDNDDFRILNDFHNNHNYGLQALERLEYSLNERNDRNIQNGKSDDSSHLSSQLLKIVESRNLIFSSYYDNLRLDGERYSEREYGGEGGSKRGSERGSDDANVGLISANFKDKLPSPFLNVDILKCI